MWTEYDTAQQRFDMRMMAIRRDTNMHNIIQTLITMHTFRQMKTSKWNWFEINRCTEKSTKKYVDFQFPYLQNFLKKVFFVQIHLEEAHQQPQTEPKIQYTDLDVSPQNFYSISAAADGYQPSGSGYAYLSTASNKDYGIYQGSPNTVLYKGSWYTIFLI